MDKIQTETEIGMQWFMLPCLIWHFCMPEGPNIVKGDKKHHNMPAFRQQVDLCVSGLLSYNNLHIFDMLSLIYD